MSLFSVRGCQTYDLGERSHRVGCSQHTFRQLYQTHPAMLVYSGSLT